MSVLESDIYSHIITWSPDGKSFVFLDSNAFERIVLPSIFKVAKFDSFLRKVSSNNIINYRSCAA
jgi:osomolarity two-component system response regulator SKN7